jgi:hypothetical protein
MPYRCAENPLVIGDNQAGIGNKSLNFMFGERCDKAAFYLSKDIVCVFKVCSLGHFDVYIKLGYFVRRVHVHINNAKTYEQNASKKSGKYGRNEDISAFQYERELAGIDVAQSVDDPFPYMALPPPAAPFSYV